MYDINWPRALGIAMMAVVPETLAATATFHFCMEITRKSEHAHQKLVMVLTREKHMMKLQASSQLHKLQGKKG